jgi:2-C-methyl-D-erythritol 4-phosphate cytidylyltransferase/2-C-methyl-D-erythritol 2,4-cyclodiphosphate synthase
MSKIYALIPAAGMGARMEAGEPKQYLPLKGRPLLYHALKTLCAHGAIERVFLVVQPGDERFHACDWSGLPPKFDALYCGGATRAASVFNGLIAASDVVDLDDWVLVHDAVRPCLTQDALDRLISTVREEKDGGLLALPVTDTLKRADAGDHVLETASRSELWTAQTPQMFRYHLLVQALGSHASENFTDEASAVERLGARPKLVRGDARNIKITYPGDIALAEAILGGGENTMRIGQGYDAHALRAGRRLVIGGVTIPHESGLDGHSDADVLLHAICDALIGAAGLGDIGRHFPDTDARYLNADSRELLRATQALLTNNGWRVVNVDATIIAQAPRMAPHISAMVANIASDLTVPWSVISVKAKTTERMGFVGRGEGMAAEAVALIAPRQVHGATG